MSKSRKSKDPFAQRESENYSNPIVSREFILQHLEQVGEPLSHPALCEQLKLQDEESIEALRRRLIAMSRDGQIHSNRRGVYGLAAHMDLSKGKVQGMKDGYGFFIPDDGSDDMFLSAREMEKLFDGDRVLARLTGYDSRGRKEGTIVEILQRRYTEIVGRYYHEQGFGVVVPDSKRITHEILVPDNLSGNAEDGQFVVAEITEYPSRRRKAIAKIVEVLGDSSTAGLEIEVALRSHDIPHVFPSSVENESDRFAAEVLEQDFAGRRDLRKIPFVTIDGEDAKDYDDAVFAQRHQRGNWTLFVAIADVSHYVQVGSALDQEAITRGTSVYFPGHVIPMLPEKLSNGLCSLKPKVDRLTMVCEMEIAASGEVTDFCFYEGVIHSHGRMTYNEVADIIQPAESESQQRLQTKLRERHESLVEHLDSLYSLYKALRQVRENNGALDFDTTETRIVFGENKKIREIVPVERNDAHRLIEECMLCANIAAARLLEHEKLPTLYRIHEGPNPNKLDNLREYLNQTGLHLPGGDKPSPSDYQQVMLQIVQRPDRHLLQTLLIRSMMQAVYQPENIGHFGLGFPAYAHFTSPIRRYPDLLVHRGIRLLIRNKQGKHAIREDDAAPLAKGEIYPYQLSDMVEFGENCSVAERRANAASYSVLDWLKCEYMKDRVGDEFTGTVSSVTSFGLFVELNDIYIEGLVHITELSNDYYHFDPVRHCLEGERTGNSYHLGDTVEVRIVRVDLDEKKIDLQMLGAIPNGKPGKHKARRKPKTQKKSRNQSGSASAATAEKEGHKKRGGKSSSKSKSQGGGKQHPQSKAGAGKAQRGKKKPAGQESGKNKPSSNKAAKKKSAGSKPTKNTARHTPRR